MSKPVRVWVDLPSALEAAVKAAGKRDRLNPHEAIRRACEEYVARHSTTPARESSGCLDCEPVTPRTRTSRGLTEMALVREPAR